MNHNSTINEEFEFWLKQGSKMKSNQKEIDFIKHPLMYQILACLKMGVSCLMVKFKKVRNY